MAAVFSVGAPVSGVRPIGAIPRRRFQAPSIASVKSCNVRCDRRVKCSLVQDISSAGDSSYSRRQTMLQILISAISFPAVVSAASAESESDLVNFKAYEDEANKFQISIPQEWLSGTGTSNTIKSVTAFFPNSASDTNVTVVITGIGPDFTRLESFGKVDEFAENLVNGLDRSWKRPPGLAAKLIDSKARNGFYYIEYTLQNPGERQRHIISAVGMANNGWYNRLYTVTGQFFEDESDKFRAQIEKSISSFRFT